MDRRVPDCGDFVSGYRHAIQCSAATPKWVAVILTYIANLRVLQHYRGRLRADSSWIFLLLA